MDKKLKILLVAIAFALICINVFGQTQNYPFKVQISGHGKKSILFIPGFACSGEVWKETRAAFEDRFTCYTLTMAGFAGVPAQPSPSFNNWENAIAEYLKTNHIQRPIVVGHSMGGGLALALAADHPDLINKIVVVDALPCLAALMNPSFKSIENKDCGSMVEQFSHITDEQFKQMQMRGIPRLLADTSRTSGVVKWSIRSDRGTFARMYCDFSNTDLRNKLNKIICPTLVLLEPSFINYKPAIEEQYKQLTSAQLRYANKGLHFIMYDDKSWCEQQLLAFIN